MRARLFCQVGELKGETFEIGEEAIIGRHPENVVVLAPAALSARHARIFYDHGRRRYMLEDLESLNGTRLDGDRVAGPEPLDHLHVITLAGRHDFIFQDLELCSARHGSAPPPRPRAQAPGFSPPVYEKTAVEVDLAKLPSNLAGRSDGAPVGPPERSEEERTRLEELPFALPKGLADRGSGDREEHEKTRHEKLPLPVPPALAQKPPKEVVETADNLADVVGSLLNRPRQQGQPAESVEFQEGDEVTFVLELLSSEGILRFELVEGENVVGRELSAPIRPENPDISRRHAVLFVRGHQVTVRDEGSRNHTFLDGEKVSEERPVQPGARLRFGSAEGRLVVAEATRGDGKKQ